MQKFEEINKLIDYFNKQSFSISKRFGKKSFDRIHNFGFEKTRI